MIGFFLVGLFLGVVLGAILKSRMSTSSVQNDLNLLASIADRLAARIREIRQEIERLKETQS